MFIGAQACVKIVREYITENLVGHENESFNAEFVWNNNLVK
jgi:hypothetical protein